VIDTMKRRSTIGLPDTLRTIVRSRAPLRISFCGGGTDVPPFPERFGGCVLSCTIDKYAYVSVRSRDRSLATRVQSADLKKVVEFSAAGTSKELSTENTLAEAIIKRFKAASLDSYMHCDAPPGSGLGSSSAMLVALAAALGRFQKIDLSASDIAELALLVERDDLGIVGGMQDQYASAFGGFNFIEFMPGEVLVHPLRLSDETQDELHYHLVLCSTGATRFSSNILAEQTQNVMNSNSDVIDALCDLKALTFEMRRLLLRGRLRDFGQLLDEAWMLKRRLASGISNDRIEMLYECAKNAGALGGKLLGAGGGGFLMVFCPFTRRQAVRDALEFAGGRVVDFQFDTRGARTWFAETNAWQDP
jgi:D-glycero-alpha-D-manno-heptose-7-phosphate kinase